MSHINRKKGIVLLADGTIFYGRSVGIKGTAFGEICFNTGVTGYQEIFTDPSYFGQIMVTTTSHIGNYGIKLSESQSKKIYISGLICKNFSSINSRVNSKPIKSWFESNNLITLCDVDTRALVRYIRDNGAMNAAISTEIDKIDNLKKNNIMKCLTWCEKHNIPNNGAIILSTLSSKSQKKHNGHHHVHGHSSSNKMKW